MSYIDDLKKDDVFRVGIVGVIFIMLILISVSCFAIDLDRIEQIESGGDVEAYNEATGAKGLYQFREIAWKDVQNHYPELKKYDYKEYAFNGEVSRVFAEKYFEILKGYLKHYGLEVTTENLIIGYNFGLGNLIKYRNGEIELPSETREYISLYFKKGGK